MRELCLLLIVLFCFGPWAGQGLLSHPRKSMQTQCTGSKRIKIAAIPTIGTANRQHACMRKRKEFELKGLFDDDLPNILGINPIEAAIIGGVLYYIYGPTTLYEYAREAGKFVSTYIPIIKQVSSDVFYEFRDYFEEEREREQLKKAGINVDSLPRRTTNVIERFQQSFQAMSEATGSASAASTLQSAYNLDAAVPDATDADNNLIADAAVANTINKQRADGRRKKKREILEEKQVDMAAIVEASERVQNAPEQELVQSLTVVKDQFESIRVATEQLSKPAADRDVRSDNVGVAEVETPPPVRLVAKTLPRSSSNSASSSTSSASSNSISNSGDGSGGLSDSSAVNAAAPADDIAPTNNALATNKFQQQLSGEWNARVLRREKYELFPAAATPLSSNTNTNYNNERVDVSSSTSTTTGRATSRVEEIDGESFVFPANYDAEDDSDIVYPYPPLPNSFLSDDDSDGDNVDDGVKRQQQQVFDIDERDDFLREGAGDIPDELSYEDALVASAAAGISNRSSSSSSSSSNNSNSDPGTQLLQQQQQALRFLRSIDDDYLALRNKLLRFFQLQGLGTRDDLSSDISTAGTSVGLSSPLLLFEEQATSNNSIDEVVLFMGEGG